MLEIIRQTHEQGAIVSLLGFDGASSDFPDSFHSQDVIDSFQEADAVILPMSGIDDDGRVDTRFSTSPLWISDVALGTLRPGTLVFTGIARPRFEAACRRLDLQLVKLMDLDEVAILNSIPTAEGAIAMAMEMMDITIHGCTAVVVGFGRCGETLARDLRALSANVRVIARRPSDLARITEMGLAAIPIERLPEAVQGADLVINTVPTKVLTDAVISQMETSSVIVDIASKPGGTDFDYAQKRGLKAKLAPSLPGLVAPKTAGRILAVTIGRILKDRNNQSS